MRSTAAALLYGLLALQNNLVRRDQLVQAAEAWVRDKRRSLVDILTEKGMLPQDERQLMDALFAKYVANMEGDLEASLAGLSSLGNVRDDLSLVADDELAQSLASMVPDAVPGTLPFQATTVADGDVTTQTKLRVLRLHARGGLGQVSVALDRALHREVAFKEMQAKFADDTDSRGRFVKEAEITGSLEHPGIVPVYGLGQYADGRPFYAMRFVKGDSLQQAIERFHAADVLDHDLVPGERSFALRELLGRFLDVCDAIAYAHSRGVLHRDLKPGNIMLGKFGETLVVDWGLAKVVGRSGASTFDVESALLESRGSGGSETAMGAVVGTPQYMSPEQAAGRVEQLGPATDVYALGATLYCLLTGQPPIPRGTLGDMLSRVQAGTWPKPRAVRRNVPRPLESICVQAMAAQPVERYPSVPELADDIRHWLADEPVRAHRESIPERMGRFERRHRSLVRFTAIAMLLLTVATLVTTNAVARRRQADRLAQSLELFLTDDLARSLDDARGPGAVGDALAEASQRFAETFADNPDIQVRLYVSFGDLLLSLGELKSAQRQFEAARQLLPTAHVATSTEWHHKVGTAIARWRQGEPGANAMMDQLDAELSRVRDPNIRRWFDLERANELKNRRDLAPLERLQVIQQAAAIYERYLPSEEEPPTDVSLNAAEMCVERAELGDAIARTWMSPPRETKAYLWSMKVSSLGQARDQLLALIHRPALANRAQANRLLSAEIWSEYAKTQDRLGGYLEADDAYFEACTELAEILGPRHWRTIETSHSWMSLLSQRLPRLDPPGFEQRLLRGTEFFSRHCLDGNSDPTTLLEQNAVGVAAFFAKRSGNVRQCERLVQWLVLDREMRTWMSQPKTHDDG